MCSRYSSPAPCLQRANGATNYVFENNASEFADATKVFKATAIPQQVENPTAQLHLQSVALDRVLDCLDRSPLILPNFRTSTRLQYPSIYPGITQPNHDPVAIEFNISHIDKETLNKAFPYDTTCKDNFVLEKARFISPGADRNAIFYDYKKSCVKIVIYYDEDGVTPNADSLLDIARYIKPSFFLKYILPDSVKCQVEKFKQLGRYAPSLPGCGIPEFTPGEYATKYKGENSAEIRDELSGLQLALVKNLAIFASYSTYLPMISHVKVRRDEAYNAYCTTYSILRESITERIQCINFGNNACVNTADLRDLNPNTTLEELEKNVKWLKKGFNFKLLEKNLRKTYIDGSVHADIDKKLTSLRYSCFLACEQERTNYKKLASEIKAYENTIVDIIQIMQNTKRDLNMFKKLGTSLEHRK